MTMKPNNSDSDSNLNNAPQSTSKKKTRKTLESMAWVLTRKTGIPGSPEREALVADASDIFLCGKKKDQSKLKPHESWTHPRCGHPFCPWCQVERAETNKADR